MYFCDLRSGLKPHGVIIGLCSGECLEKEEAGCAQKSRMAIHCCCGCGYCCCWLAELMLPAETVEGKVQRGR